MRKYLILLLLSSCDPPLGERHVTVFGVIISIIGIALFIQGCKIAKNDFRDLNKDK
jgi:hypothetical protein